MKKLLLMVAATAIFSCNYSKTNRIKAHIFERKLLTNGKLMVYYVFQIDSKLVKDSSVMENKVLPHDSVTIKIASMSPIASRIDLSNNQ